MFSNARLCFAEPGPGAITFSDRHQTRRRRPALAGEVSRPVTGRVAGGVGERNRYRDQS